LTSYKDIFISLCAMLDALNSFRALADPTRLRIITLLRAKEISVGELAHVLGQSQPRVSRHVKILADAGLLDRRKEGSWVFLTLGDPGQLAPLLALLEQWGELLSAGDQARLQAVEADRAAAAEHWFATHASEWDALRSRHIAEPQVEARIVALLQPAPVGRLVDLGTGTGRMIELLGKGASSALGIDRSPEMLRLARARIAQAGLTQTELRQGDLFALPLLEQQADTVIIHQVLHYLHQPVAALAEAVRILAPGGRLLIVDFAAHDYDELRRSAAHVRLGFADAQIAAWFTQHGLTLAASEALHGGELTVKLWLGVKAPSRQEKAA
jgi:ubiquinone/menaquinone biosynthesis C-methylase UbiE/DNA-binding transcriptional ArsR family regulator